MSKVRVVLRACDEDVDGAAAQIMLDYEGEITDAVLEGWKLGLSNVFYESFERLPVRVGVAVLPWATELDADPDPPIEEA